METAINEKHLVKQKFQEKFAFLYDAHSLFYHVLLLIGIGIGFFGIALLTQKFTTPFSGDFSQQYYAFEYNFYDDWWTFFKTGQFPFYDSNTFLGADNVISNTYYGLFSPFTFPILFFPRSFLPQAMALMSIAKLVVGALLFRVYLKYIGASEMSARTFSIAYAFMGWCAYYLWFNNFYEVLTFFPLILFGIEKIIRQKSIWACSLGYFLMGLGNYFFLLTFGIFGVIYAGFRFFQTFKDRGGFKAWKDHLIVICLGIAGFAIGYLMCAAVMIPAVMGSFGISRTSTSDKYFDVLKQAFADKDYNKAFEIIFTYWHPNVVRDSSVEANKYYFMFTYPLASYFYPVLSCRYVNIVGYSEFENAGSSIFFFTPCIIMFGGCLYRSFRNKKISHFIAIAMCVFALFVPFFYFLSGAFTNNYGRWEIIVPALGLMYIALNFDHRNEIPRPVIIVSAAVAFAMMLGTYFLAQEMIKIYGYDKIKRPSKYLYSLDLDDRIAVVWYELILCSIESFLICGFWKKKYLDVLVKIFIIFEVVIMGNIVANMHYLQSIDNDVNGGLSQLSSRVALIEKVNKEDSSFFRMYNSTADNSHVNIPESDNYNGMTTFHTFYNNNVDDFVHMMNMMSWEESWSSHYLYKHQYLESFLGVKYYLTRDSDTTYYNPDRVYEPNVPLNYSLYLTDEENGFRVYKNEHHIDFAMSHDKLYFKHQKEDNPKRNQYYDGSNSLSENLRNEEVLFKGVILNDDDVNEIMESHPDSFVTVDKAPYMDMDYTTMHRSGIYAPYKINDKNEKEYVGIDPENPLRYVDEKYEVSSVYKDDVPKNAYEIVYEPTEDVTFPHDEYGTYFVINYPIRNPWSNYNTCIWLIGEDGKTITFDELRNTEADVTWVGRALYSRVPVSKIIVNPLNEDSAIYDAEDMNIYFEEYGKVVSKLDKAADNGIKDLVRHGNTYNFNTNYDKEKFVVTQLAYTEGWKVKVTNSNGDVYYPKVYNSQGGFVGFVAPAGNASYEITYMTPGFIKWAIVSASAFVALGAITFTPIIVKKHKEKRGEPLNSSN